MRCHRQLDTFVRPVASSLLKGGRDADLVQGLSMGGVPQERQFESISRKEVSLSFQALDALF